MAKIVENFLISKAKNAFKQNNTVREWMLGIIILTVLLICTCLVSIYSSYEYYHSLIAPLITNPVALFITTLFCLILLETLTQVALIKFWRFSFTGKLWPAIILFVIGGGLYFLSWFTSCNGLAMAEGAKVDNTAQIKSNFNEVVQTTTDENKKQINDYLTTIETIRSKPEGWDGIIKHATILTKSQRNEISNLYSKIEAAKKEHTGNLAKIQADQSKEVSSNMDQVKSTESKYYRIVAILMIIQILANAFIMIIYRVIDREFTKMSEKIQEAAVDLRTEAQKLALQMITGDIQTFFVELSNAFTPIVESKNETSNKKELAADQKKQKIIGFMNQKKDSYENRINENSNDNRNVTETPVNTGIDTDKRICKECKKTYIYMHHKQVYCCEACRVKSWEVRTGRKLKFKKSADNV